MLPNVKLKYVIRASMYLHECEVFDKYGISIFVLRFTYDKKWNHQISNTNVKGGYW